MLSEVLKAAKLSYNSSSTADDSAQMLRNAIAVLEQSGLVNAGTGAHLTAEGKVECEASFASNDYYGSVACLDYSLSAPSKVLLPSVHAYQLADRQRLWKQDINRGSK